MSRTFLSAECSDRMSGASEAWFERRVGHFGAVC
jgi:hypothetical protein